MWYLGFNVVIVLCQVYITNVKSMYCRNAPWCWTFWCTTYPIRFVSTWQTMDDVICLHWLDTLATKVIVKVKWTPVFVLSQWTPVLVVSKWTPVLILSHWTPVLVVSKWTPVLSDSSINMVIVFLTSGRLTYETTAMLTKQYENRNIYLYQTLKLT